MEFSVPGRPVGMETVLPRISARGVDVNVNPAAKG